ncbi:D-alanine--D-alanyl carrier protein ligase [Seminavis robusta]|uniref:D-alanine--D-alanyl carrier protein ligase n=1 Tax=Seminavis robusta TaxID=568900 RepID=A0A9N8DFY2_9STRA|nr:D-alanine--D-alanyl carrier protein ligase [Seminavis robusta]|eukprot:Sro122_g059330.1 D-alanine--D-alanyl carrier protein ligase (1842) ;mRNA; f:91918-97618
MKNFSTILEALDHHARETPNKTVLTWVDIDCKERKKMTFKEVEDEANAVAARLLKLGCQEGDRVMVAYPFGLEFLAAMFGAMKIGVIPCSIYPPNPHQLKMDMPKFRGFVEDAGAKFALSTTAFATVMTAASVFYKTGAKWIGTDKLSIKKSNPNKPKPHEMYVGVPEDICFIQYTSGSTGRPKGVMISHHNLADTCQAGVSLTDCWQPTSLEVLWVPQYHDMGLVTGFMGAIFCGNPLVMASPLDFIANPLLWTDMVETYQATITSAPNFAYALLLKRLKQANRSADWSCIKRAMFGGEPAQSHVVEAVASTLSIKPDNIYNIYGMAEMVVLVTGGQAKADFDGLVCCGEVDSPTLKLRIVQDGNEVQDGEVGSIWAQSPRVAAGYFGQPELSNATFANVLPTYEGHWLDTGDLGKIVDGQLYITGRVKDVIIINGKNYYPTDVELSIDETFGGIIRPGRTTAFQHGEDTVGITVEGRKGFNKSANEHLATQIANHVSQVHGLSAFEVVVLKLGVTPKTTSGKLKRSEIRKITTTGDWMESTVLLRFQSPLNKSQESSFLERSFAMNGVTSCEFYQTEDRVHQAMEQQETLPSRSLAGTLEDQPHIAVVGAGAAGLITALRLAQRNVKVTVFERNEQIGGHARHVEVFGHQRNPAFGVFLLSESPNLIVLAKELGVEPIPLGESRNNRGIISMGETEIPPVPQAEVNRFIGEMQVVHKAGAGQDETIGEFFEQNQFDHHFIVYFYIGKIVSFFPGQTIQDYLNIPLELVAWFVVGASISGEQLLRLCNKEYMDSFEAKLKRLGVTVRVNSSPKVLSRDTSGVTIATGIDGEDPIRVDKVVLAVPPNAAANILGDAISADEDVLAKFDCPLETLVLHTDSKWVDKHAQCILYANVPDCEPSMLKPSDTIPLTSSFLSDTDGCTPIYITHAYATHTELQFDSPVKKMSFTHTKITCEASKLRKSLLQHQGKQSTYFAGGWTRGSMLHEDAIVSGLLVANAILREYDRMQHSVLNRNTEIPSNQPSHQQATAGAQTNRKIPFTDDFSDRYLNTVMSVFGSQIESSKTWAENGMTSIKSAELRNKVEEELHVVLPPNFAQLYETPEELEAFLLLSEGQSFPTSAAVQHPEFQWNNPRSHCTKLQMGIVQILGFVAIILLLLTAVLPSYFVGAKLSAQCDSSDAQNCSAASWLLLPLLFPLFFFSFSMLVVVVKYAVVGKYRHQEINLMSWDYIQWWFVDRLIHVWELLVGQFLLETKFVWLFYWLLGADIAWSARVDKFIREWDLVSIGRNTTVGYALKCRKFRPLTNESPKLIFRPIIIRPDCQVSGMICPGAVIGAGSKIERLTVVEEGGQVPSGAIARGNPACNVGVFQCVESDWKEESLLDVFRILWMFLEAYHYSAIYFLANSILEEVLPSWRYDAVLHWFLLFPLSSLFAIVTSIILKWLLIGRRDPSEEYEGTLWRKATNWACDFHFRVASWMLSRYMGPSRLDCLIQWFHGLDVDVSSIMYHASTICPPSKVDFVKVRQSFLSLTHIELDSPSGEKIEISQSSVGRDTTIHAGAKVIRSNIPSRSQVSDKIYDLNPPSTQLRLTWSYVLLEMLLPEILQIVLLAFIFWSIIPEYELARAALEDNTSTRVVVSVVVGAAVLQLIVWIILAKMFEWVVLNAVHPSLQSGIFPVYSNYIGSFRDGNPIEVLLMGTPLFNHYARFMGAEVTGDLWFFDCSPDEFGKYHFQGPTIMDNAYPRGHYLDINGLTLDDVYISGVVHPGCYIAAGAVVHGEENGPLKSFFPTSTGKAGNKEGGTNTVDNTLHASVSLHSSAYPLMNTSVAKMCSPGASVSSFALP